jgi:ribosome-associated protein
MHTPIHLLREDEVEFTAVRAQGAGGQNVNKVSSAIHLRFDIVASTLPDDVKERLLALHDSRITKAGELIIKAQQHRTQDMNRLDAMLRLHEIVNAVEFAPLVRKATKPSKAAKLKRLDNKGLRSETKAQRSKITGDQ